MDPLSKIQAISAIGSLADSGATLSQLLLETAAAAANPHIVLSDERTGDERDIINESTLLCELGTEISLFCATLKQLQRVLSVTDGSGVSVVDGAGSGTHVYQPQIQGRRCRASAEAVDTTHQIVARCKRIFAHVERDLSEPCNTTSSTRTAVTSSSVSGWGGAEKRDSAESRSLLSGLITLSLQENANAKSDKVLEGIDLAELRAGLQNLVQKGKIRTYTATIESCKITLTLMVTILAYGEVISTRRSRDEKITVEDTEQDALIRSLVLAQKHTSGRLARIELEEESSITDASTIGMATGTSSFNGVSSNSYFFTARPQTPITALPRAGTLGSPADAPPLQSFDDNEENDIQKEERASIWLKRLMSDNSRSDSGHLSAVDSGFCSRTGSTTSSSEASNSVFAPNAPFPSSSSKHSLVESLLAKWTDQAPHWASLQYQQPAIPTFSATIANKMATAVASAAATTSTAPRGPDTPRKGGIKRQGAPTSLNLGILATPKLRNTNGFTHWNKVTAYHVPQAESTISFTNLGSEFGKSVGTGVVPGTGIVPDKSVLKSTKFNFASHDGITRNISEPVSPSSRPASSKQQQPQQNRVFTSLLSLDPSTSMNSFDATTDDIDPAWGIPIQKQAEVRQGLLL